MADQWIREYLRQLGYSDNQIGWNDSDPGNPYVTLNGQYFIKPASETGGKSYADPAALKNAYTAYQGNSAYQTYQNQMNSLNNQVNALKNTPAYSYNTPSPTYTAPEAYQSAYAGQAAALLSGAVNNKFSYDPTTDPSYQAYKDAYARQGQAASESALANTSAATGGIPSSYAAAAASQATQAYAKKAADVIPQLEQQAYTRYAADQDRAINAAGAYNTLDQTAYNQYADNRNFGYQQYADALNQYNTNRNFDYGVYNDSYGRSADLASLYANLAGQTFDQYANTRDSTLNQEQAAQQFEYQKQQDALAAQQWQQQFDYQKQQDAVSNAQAAARIAGSGSSSGSKPTLTAAQTLAAVKAGTTTPQVLAAYEYYYGEPYQNTTATAATDKQKTYYNTIYNGLLSKFTPKEAIAYVDKMGKDFYVNLIGEGLYDQLVTALKSKASAQTGAQAGADSGNTYGAIYTAMSNSQDPDAWVTQNAPYMTNDELKYAQSILKTLTGSGTAAPFGE